MIAEMIMTQQSGGKPPATAAPSLVNLTPQQLASFQAQQALPTNLLQQTPLQRYAQLAGVGSKYLA